MLATRRHVSVGVRREAAKTAALLALLTVSAFSTALCHVSVAPSGLGWFSLAPLFLIIRAWRPRYAMLGGALWGSAVYVFSLAQPDPAVSLGVGSLLRLAAIPAIYAYLTARLTRSIGFNPFVLGVAWMCVDPALAAVGHRSSLLGESQAAAGVAHWLGQLFGYVLVAFLVALVSASLVSVLGMARLSLPPCRRRTMSAHGGASLVPQVAQYFPRFALRLLLPRAPPTQLGMP